MDPDQLADLDLTSITEPGFQAAPERVSTEFDLDDLKALSAHFEALRRIHQRLSGEFPDPKEESALSVAQRLSHKEAAFITFMLLALAILCLYLSAGSPKA